MAKSLALWLQNYNVSLDNDVIIDDVVLDSRQVKEGDCFIAVKGETANGELYIEKAIEAGAKAVVIDAESKYVPDSNTVQFIRISDLRSELGSLAKSFYGPEVNTRVVGVTGTNGKSTITLALAQALSQLEQSAWVIGTLGCGEVTNLDVTQNTTPDIFSNWKLLADADAKGVDFLIMEVSSHGLEQGRVSSLPIEMAVFSNLTHEHLDYHGDMESYFNSKRKLFLMSSLKSAIINGLDNYGAKLADDSDVKANKLVLSKNSEKLSSSISANCLKSVVLNDDGLSFEMEFDNNSIPFKSCFLGSFNAQNLAQVVLCLTELGFEQKDIQEAIHNVKPVAGRMQSIQIEQAPLVVVDYAHSPDALENALLATREHTEKNLWCVFGCGGDRDSSKRPVMGKIAQKLSDCTIVTSDNPRSEQPKDIIEDIKHGLSVNDDIYFIEDREQAIEFAIKSASQGDVILIAGKGHEDYQEIKGTRHHFSDAEIAQKYLRACA